MPRYDYQCQTCQQVFEVRASIQEKQAGLKPVCPNCQSETTRQLITAGLVLHPASATASQGSCCGPNAKPGCCG